jgi:hypothetical protein
VFTIPNVEKDSYKRGNENLLHAKERHALPSSETFVLAPVLNLKYTEFSTQFRTHIQRNLQSSYAVFIPNYVNNAISALDNYLPSAT